jgi:hypothetical protein
LARESSGKGSRYGQYALGLLYQLGQGGVAKDDAQAAAFYRLAAVQGLDDAQWMMGIMYFNGYGVVEDDDEGRRWHKLAEAQGHREALLNEAMHQEDEDGLDDVVEAIRWYRRAQAAGHPHAAADLQRLRANPLYF